MTIMIVVLFVIIEEPCKGGERSFRIYEPIVPSGDIWHSYQNRTLVGRGI